LVGGLGPGAEGAGKTRGHLVPREPLPLAESHLLERLRLPHRELVRRRDDGGVLPRPPERARPDRGHRRAGEEPRRRLGLSAAGGGERAVAPTLETALPVPVGLRVTEEQHAHRAQRSARTFWAARTAAPKSTGCPSSCSTCSSAASP